MDQARAIVAGLGAALPPPTLQGLEVPGSAGAAARPAAPAAAPVPAPGPAGYAYAAPPGAMPGAPVAMAAAPAPGAPPAAAVAAAPGGFPPLPVSELQRYQAQFVALDADRDGFLTVSRAGPSSVRYGLRLLPSSRQYLKAPRRRRRAAGWAPPQSKRWALA